MKTALVALMLACGAVACRSPRASSSDAAATANQSPPLTQGLPQPSVPVLTGPSAPVGPVLFLVANGDFAVDPRDVDTASWHGLFQADSTFTLAAAHVTLEPLDAAGEPVTSVGHVRVTGPGRLLFLVRDGVEPLPRWIDGPVTPGLGQTWLRPGEYRDLRVGSSVYRVEASGRGEGGNIYELELRLIEARTGTSQVVFAYHPPNGTTPELRPAPSILWFGDIDRDGRPDLVLEDSMSEVAGEWTLYLSSNAPQGALVRRVTHIMGVGD